MSRSSSMCDLVGCGCTSLVNGVIFWSAESVLRYVLLELESVV